MKASGHRWVAVLLATAALAACVRQDAAGRGAEAPDTARWNGFYQSDTLPALAGGRRVAHLMAGPDTLGGLAIEFVGRGTVLHRGYWTARGDEFTLQPVRGDGTPSAPPLVWRLEGDRLVPVKWNRDTYGEVGLTLTKRRGAALAADSSKGGT